MIIENDIKLEINTSNFSKGFDFPNPHTDIIRRYKELGGLYVTVGPMLTKPNLLVPVLI